MGRVPHATRSATRPPRGRRGIRGALGVGAAVSLASLLVCASASASSSTDANLELTWTAPESCPDRAAVLARIHRLVPSPPASTLVVHATAYDQGRGFRVDVEMQGAAEGTRTLHAATCASAARATALLVALALDPTARVREIDDAPAEPATLAPPAPPPPVAPQPPPPEPPTPAPRDTVTPRALAAFASAAVSAERALLPGVVPAIGAGLGVDAGSARIDLAFRWTPSRATLLAGSAAGVDVGMLDLALRGCVVTELGALGVHGCTAARGVRFAGSAFGVTESYRKSAFSVALEPGAILRFPARSRIALELDVALVVPLMRPEFGITRSGVDAPIFRVSPFGARAGVGAIVRF